MVASKPWWQFLNPKHYSLDVRLTIRSAICLTLPLIVGLATNHRATGTLVALGALWGVSQDGVDRWRTRSNRLLGVTACAAFGMTYGALLARYATAFPVAVSLLALIALVAGVIEASLWASQGMFLLLGAVVGMGLGVAHTAWEAGLAIGVGAFWSWAVAAITDARSRWTDQRLSVAQAFTVLAEMFDTMGSAKYQAVHARARTVLDYAQDVVGAKAIAKESLDFAALYQCFIVALQFGELTAHVASNKQDVRSTVATALRHVAATIRDNQVASALALTRTYEASFREQGFWDVAIAFNAPSIEQLQLAPPFRTSISRLPLAERFRFAGLLTTVTIVATVLAHSLSGPKGYWLPMSAVFIFRPDTGPVMQRALARTAGTLAGVTIAAAVDWLGQTQLLLIVLCCAMAIGVPWSKKRHYALTVMFFTPIVFVFIGLLHPEVNYFGTRIIDTALGAAIVLAVDLLVWVRAPSLRPGPQVERARSVTSEYLATTTASDPVTRHSLRRKALRAVARASDALVQSARERRPAVDDPASARATLRQLREAIDSHASELFRSSRPEH